MAVSRDMDGIRARFDDELRRTRCLALGATSDFGLLPLLISAKDLVRDSQMRLNDWHVERTTQRGAD